METQQVFAGRSVQRLCVVPGGSHVGTGNSSRGGGGRFRYGRLVFATGVAVHAAVCQEDSRLVTGETTGSIRWQRYEGFGHVSNGYRTRDTEAVSRARSACNCYTRAVWVWIPIPVIAFRVYRYFHKLFAWTQGLFLCISGHGRLLPTMSPHPHYPPFLVSTLLTSVASSSAAWTLETSS